MNVMNRKAAGFLALAGVLAPSLASANLLIDDGGEHEFNFPTLVSVLLNNNSALNIGSGGSIVGDGTNLATFLSRGALSSLPGSNSSIRVFGDGHIFAGGDRYAIARAFAGNLFLAGNSAVTGDIFGYATVSPPFGSALQTFIANNARVEGNIFSDGRIRISDNAVITGNLFEANGGIALDMDGGTIMGHVGAGSLVGHSALITGGSILGGYGGNSSNIDFSIHGGQIDGGWSVYSQDMLVEVRGGEINGGMRFSGNVDTNSTGDQVSLFSGAINAAAGEWLLDFASSFDLGDATSFDCSANTSRFDIWGGQLGAGSAGNGIRLDVCATLDVYGTNLSYSGGLLSGFLADGSLLNVSVTEESRWSGAVRLHDTAVPEPGTLGLLGVALGAMAMTRRRRRQTDNLQP